MLINLVSKNETCGGNMSFMKTQFIKETELDPVNLQNKKAKMMRLFKATILSRKYIMC